MKSEIIGLEEIKKHAATERASMQKQNEKLQNRIEELGAQIAGMRVQEIQTLRSNREMEDKMKNIQAEMDQQIEQMEYLRTKKEEKEEELKLEREKFAEQNCQIEELQNAIKGKRERVIMVEEEKQVVEIEKQQSDKEHKIFKDTVIKQFANYKGLVRELDDDRVKPEDKDNILMELMDKIKVEEPGKPEAEQSLDSLQDESEIEEKENGTKRRAKDSSMTAKGLKKGKKGQARLKMPGIAPRGQPAHASSSSDDIESPCIILDQVDAEEAEPEILRMQTTRRSVKVPENLHNSLRVANKGHRKSYFHKPTTPREQIQHENTRHPKQPKKQIERENKSTQTDIGGQIKPRLDEGTLILPKQGNLVLNIASPNTQSRVHQQQETLQQADQSKPTEESKMKKKHPPPLKEDSYLSLQKSHVIQPKGVLRRGSCFSARSIHKPDRAGASDTNQKLFNLKEKVIQHLEAQYLQAEQKAAKRRLKGRTAMNVADVVEL